MTAAIEAGATDGGGLIHVEVWPSYVGLGEMTGSAVRVDGTQQLDLHEPVDQAEYQRGQITWKTAADGAITGHGKVWAPKGVYTHIIYARGPVGNVCGAFKPEHPIVFDRPGFVDVGPIQNQEVLPRG
jgi:hypothetical protein